VSKGKGDIDRVSYILLLRDYLHLVVLRHKRLKFSLPVDTSKHDVSGLGAVGDNTISCDEETTYSLSVNRGNNVVPPVKMMLETTQQMRTKLTQLKSKTKIGSGISPFNNK
jgi:hypothetical protein